MKRLVQHRRSVLRIAILCICSLAASNASRSAVVQNQAPASRASLASVPLSLLDQARQHPQALLRAVVQTELTQNSGQRPPLRYRVHKVTQHLDTTKEIIETRDGDVACLVATAGQPLTGNEWAAERARLEQLRANPALEKHRLRREEADVQRFNQILRDLPDALQLTFMDTVPTTEGPALRFSFQPNPNFSPDIYFARVLLGLKGQIWINAAQMRIQSFDAHQFQPIDFGWGLLGRIDKDGSAQLTQAQVMPQLWNLTHLQVTYKGRALFRTLQSHVNETASDYSRIDPTLTYQQAIDLLLRDHCGAPQQ